MKKAIFLDRDGVINRERGTYTWLLEDFILNDGLIESLLTWQKAGYIFIIVSNQSGIAKGIFTKEEVEYLHLHLVRRLNNSGINIEEIYFCPHHPDTGNCLCRKPGSLLIEKALARFDIDARKSFFIGDAERDVQAARKAGVEGILIHSNQHLGEIASRIPIG